MKALWESYFDAFHLDAIIVPATIVTARPIDDVEPFLTINGKKVPSLRRQAFTCKPLLLQEKGA